MSGPSAFLGLDGAASPRAGVRVSLPEGARVDERRGSIDLAQVPGARVTAHGAWLGVDGVALRGACVRAPSDRWAPGIEAIVLGRATQVARDQLDLDVQTWTSGATDREGPRVAQRLEGTGQREGVAFSAFGKHVLGFVGDGRDVALCSVLCVEPAPALQCAALIDGAAAEGAFVDAPAPSAWVRVVVAAADHPAAALTGASALAAAVIGALLATRPRPPRPRRARPPIWARIRDRIPATRR